MNNMIIFADHLKSSEKKMKFLSLIILLMFFALDFYAFQIFKALQLSKIFEKAYWIFNVVGYILITYSVMIYDPQVHNSKILPLMIGYTILIGVPKLIPIFLGTAEDLFRTGNRLISGEWPSRRRFIALIGWGIAAVPFVGILHGIFRGRSQYRILKNSATIEGLPDAFSGFKILQISDIHSGSFVDFKEVELGVNMILEQDVDAIVFTGDLVNNVYSEMTPC